MLPGGKFFYGQGDGRRLSAATLDSVENKAETGENVVGRDQRKRAMQAEEEVRPPRHTEPSVCPLLPTACAPGDPPTTIRFWG